VDGGAAREPTVLPGPARVYHGDRFADSVNYVVADVLGLLLEWDSESDCCE
jgi:hypothetical protein